LIVKALAEVKQCTEFWFAHDLIPNLQNTPHRSATAFRDRNNAARTVELKSVASTVGAQLYSSSRPAASHSPCPAAAAVLW
jgi:hypothetical protein